MSGLEGDRKMRVIVPFGQYSVGAIISPTAAYREWLVRLGRIVDADTPRAAEARAHMTAELPIVKRGPGRPRKNGG